MRTLIRTSAFLPLQKARWTFGKLWDWWTTEIATFLPKRLKAYFRGGDALVVRASAEAVFFQDKKGFNQSVFFDKVSTDLPPDVQSRLDRSDAIVLFLPAKQVLRRTIKLPMAAAGDLSSAIPFQLARQTPFPVESTSFAYRMTGRDKAEGTIRVELAMTSKAKLDSLRSKLAGIGVHLSATRIEADDAVPPLEFKLPSDLRRNAWSREPWRLIAIAAILIAVMGPCLVAWYVHAAADRAVASIAAAAKAASAAEGLQHELEEALSSAAFVHSRISGPSAIELLRAATAALPDDSWVYNLEIKGAGLRLNGYSGNVRSVLERLQAVPEFDKIEFPSPIVHDLARKQDRFDILIHVRTNPERIFATH